MRDELGGEVKSADERKALLARTVTNLVAQRGGRRVESQSDFQAVIVRGRHVRNVLHLVLSVITVGIWIPVWLVMWLIYRERRDIVAVDDSSNVNVQNV